MAIKKSSTRKKPLKFYSLKFRKSFTTSDYTLEKKQTRSGGRLFAKTTYKGGVVYRIVGAF